MLDRLELYNFKSYRGRQTIGPFLPFSCVIGPNGAGKSNTLDAIAFVLGVRSASLRSAALKDLVYRSGRQKGKGKAANQDGEEEGEEEDDFDEEGDEENVDGERTAWVMMVYVENEREWRFRRSITTAGTSEYRLNDKAVTYKAYNEQLEKFNILVKAKNFLVFQGDVEAVASQSPKDLAKLIDQISGSLDLKAEYDKAASELQRASDVSVSQQSRRKGVNGEIKQYKEMKKEAERWKKLGEEKDAAILQHLVWKLFHVDAGIERNTATIGEINESLATLRANHATFEAQVKAAKKESSRATKEVAKQERAVKAREKDLEDARPELVEIEVKMAHAESKLKRSDEAKVVIERELTDKLATVDQYKGDLKTVHRASEVLAEKRRKDAQSKGFTLSDGDLKEYHDLKSAASRTAIDQRQAHGVLQQDQKTRHDKLATTTDKLGVAQRKLDKLTDAEATATALQETTKSEFTARSKDLLDAKKELSSREAVQTQTAQTVAELNEKLAQCLGSLQQAGADKNESNREAKTRETIASLKKTFPGVMGRLVDLVKPSSNKYSTAVMTVLGRNIDSVVVDNEKTSISCVEYLRVQRAGQMTFIPLETIQAKAVNDKYRSFARGARLAIDCIEYNASIERAVQFACGNTLICDNMEIARYVCYEKGQEVKAVTLEGTIIHKGGNITGGVVAGGQSRHFEEREVEVLRQREAELKSKLAEIARNRPRGSADDELKTEIVRLESALTLLRQDLESTKGRLAGIQAELKVAEKTVEALTAERDALTADLATIESKSAKLKKVIDAAEDTVFAKFCARIKVANIRVYEDTQLSGAQGDNEAKLKIETQIARLNLQMNFETAQAEQLRERIVSLEAISTKHGEALARLTTDKATALEEHNAIETEILALKETLAELQVVQEEKAGLLDEVKKKGAKTGRTLDKALKDIGSCNDEIERLASERFAVYRRCKLEELDLPLNKGSLDDVPIEEIVPRTNAMDVDGDEDGTQQVADLPDFGVEVDFEALEDEEREDDSTAAEEALLAKIEKLVAEMERMSPNMKAIDKLGDSETRFKSIDKEFEAARESAKDAKDAFMALKKQRCELFTKAYNHISNKINLVYQDLTKGKSSPQGGVAYLTLEDSDEPYLHGIKYHAMPPMKRFRDMEQLSGGEKTMAALALLFAIHSYHPSPFFVLDEVDAALDATNVGRIARYCKKLADPSFQFIVISLKAAFFENASALVGIYRDGGSKTVTLDLGKYVE